MTIAARRGADIFPEENPKVQPRSSRKREVGRNFGALHNDEPRAIRTQAPALFF